MIVEIITIGDEVVAGNILNTNTQFLADQLWRYGFQVEYHTSIRDDDEKITEALTLSKSRADMVLITGGLGPTADDFTIEIAAKTLGKELILDQDYLQYLEKLYLHRGRELSENNKKQALVPKDGLIFKNKVGTAPGIALNSKGKWFYFMAGVPVEMKHIFKDYVLPHILKNRSDQIYFKTSILRTFGIAESDLDQKLKDLYHDRTYVEGVRIGFRAHFPEILIKLSAWHKDENIAEKLLGKVESKISKIIGENLYGKNEESLESVVGKLLKKNHQTLALAESCTGGFIASKLTDISGSSDYFKGGVVAYSNEIKENILKVHPEILKKHGAVSSECVIAMAQGVRNLMKTDYAIAVTGIAGPTGGSKDKPVGTVHIALVGENFQWEKKYFFNRGRDSFKKFVYGVSLNRLRLSVLAKS